MDTPAFTDLADVLRKRALHQPEARTYAFLEGDEEDARSLTNAELDRQARAIAATLQRLGARGERALLLYPPGLDYVAAFFGCVYAGVTAVPAYPPDPSRLERTLPRLQAIVADASASVALTTEAILSMTPVLFEHAPDLQALRWVASDALQPGIENAWEPPPLGTETLAFLQYTSGSTGSPKGVMLSHGNLLHNLEAMKESYGVGENEVCVSWLPPYHDMGLIACILGLLYCGGTSILMSPLDFLQRPSRWLRAISRYRATICGGPNFGYELSLRKTSAEERASLDLSCWRVAVCGAEPIRHETLQRFSETFAPCGFQLQAFYPSFGLAESTLMVTGGKTAAQPRVRTLERRALAQRRLADARPDAGGTTTVVGCGAAVGSAVHVIDPDLLTPCPPDRIGEVWVSGPGVAQGYWNRPEDTERTFRARVRGGGAGGPLLRTGDLGFMHEGELFIAGRLKDLIILRGRNLYPEDIETTVQASHPSLKPGCGAAVAVEAGGEERLAVVQEIDTRKPADPEEVAGLIRQAVAETYEVAVHQVVLIRPGTIPKTSSGKIQRHACRAQLLAQELQVVAAVETRAGGPPAPGPQPIAWLREAVAAELQQEPSRIDPAQPLTRWGLDSLAAVALANRIERELGVDVSPARLMGGMSLAGLSELCARAAPAALEPLPAPVPEVGDHPLSRGQQALWYLHQLAPESAAYNISHALQLSGPLDGSAMKRAWQALVERHPALRTVFPASGGIPTQRIRPRGEVDFAEEDARALGPERLATRLEEEAGRPFDLERGPLLRVRLLQRGVDEHVLLVVIHHIAADLWSLSVLARELRLLLAAQATGTPPQAPVTHHCGDYARWEAERLRGPRGAALQRYWREALAGDLPALDLPLDRPRPPVQTYRGASHPFRLDLELTRALDAIGHARGATRHATLLAAFSALLHRYTRQEDILIGTPAYGRSRPEWADLVGYLVNPLVLRARFAGDPTFTQLLDQVAGAARAALEHQDYPFSLLVEQLQPARDPSRSPLFQAMFVLQQAPRLGESGVAALAVDDPRAMLELGELRVKALALNRGAAQVDLTLRVTGVGGELAGAWEYNTDLFEPETIARLSGHFARLLAALAAHPEQRVATAPLLDGEERERVLVTWNRTRQPHPEGPCLHTAFEAQAAARPTATALIDGATRWTYGELNVQANQLAHRLRSLGIGPERRVGILLNRTAELVVAALGVLKAGGAYVPLDPSYPGERLAFMAEDGRVAALVTTAALAPRLPPLGGPLLRVDADREAIARERGEDPPPRALPENLAYVVYTSGSTGKPKGVAIEHRCAVNVIHWARQALRPEELAGVLAAASLSWDISVFEIFGTLSLGGCLVLAENTLQLPSLPAAGEVTLLYAVPSALAELLRTSGLPSSVRAVLVGGEAVPQSLLRALHARDGAPRVICSYGPSETTVHSLTMVLERGMDRHQPLGRPIVNTEVYALDPHGQPVPTGAVGELFIGGAGVGRGYLERPALTAERFLPDPFSGRPGARLYRSGDLGRFRPDGEIDFRGRVDHQVKVRGFRIELGEIEAALARHPAVQECVAVAREDGSGHRRLVAYAASAAQPAPSPDVLRSFLAERLPGYLVPAAFVVLPALPRSPNGKVDRRALPPPPVARPALSGAYASPRNGAEEQLAAIWARVLRIDRVGIEDNFFDLGGDSLRAVQLASEVSAATGVELPVKAVLTHPTVAAEAEVVAELRARARSRVAPPAGRAAPAAQEGAEVDEPRPLLSLFAAGELAPVDAAAVAYFPRALLAHASLTPEDVIDGWCAGLPVLGGVYETSLGRIATVLLPRFDHQLHQDLPGLLRGLVQAVEMAGRIGARNVSLTGLLPSATGYGRDVVSALAGRNVPAVTTGHATTAAAVVLTVRELLSQAGRDLARERVGFLGLGSIGAASLRLMLRCLPHPMEIALCDLYSKRDALESMERSLREELGFRGAVRIHPSRAEVPEAFYESTLMVGATSAAEVLDVDRLRPGTLLADDSGPHCFRVDRAFHRLEASGDLLFTVAGLLRSPQPIRHLRHRPREVERALGGATLPWLERPDPRQITGCILSSLLAACFDQLPPTVGLVDTETSRRHYETLERLQIQAPRLQCDGLLVPERAIARFRERFGG
jgi:amino acid adenylation domain-containing protein